jgi:hypothetical protein
MSEKDLPQPGLDDSDDESDNPSDENGEVTVDEPTKPVLDPEKDESL